MKVSVSSFLYSTLQFNPNTLLAQLNPTTKNPNPSPVPLIHLVILFSSNNIPYYVVKIGNLCTIVDILAIDFVGFVVLFFMVLEVFELCRAFASYLCPVRVFSVFVFDSIYIHILFRGFRLVSISAKKYGNKCDNTMFVPFPSLN